MRILPVLQANRNFVNNTYNSRNNKSNVVHNSQNNKSHKYTGIPSVDLAYASMFDNEIARDLKLMGLI